MKTLRKMMLVLVGLMSLVAAASAKLADVDVPTSPNAGKGFWMGTFATATNFAHTTGTPLVLVWSKKDCDYCNDLKTMFLTTQYKNWMASQPYAFCLIEGNSSWQDVGVNKGSGAKAYASSAGGRCKSLSGTPFVSLVWERTVGDVAENFMGRNGKMLVRSGGLFTQFTESVEKCFADYREDPAGTFACGNTVGDRLEAEVGYTTFVDVPLKRETGVASADVLTWSYGAESGVADVTWSAGETAKVVRVVTDFPAAAAGDVMRLTIERLGGGDATTNAITFINRENSPKNPCWIGTRTAETLAWGEWTMDLDVATNKVIAFNRTNPGSRAYTLAYVAGGLWCPDCARTDSYFVDTPEFKAWATSNNVACVCVDIPNYPKNNGCLLNRVVNEVSAKYIASDPEKGAYQSGTGYLSRWMVGENEANAVMSRNAKLVGTNTLKGGWNRPERANQKRTGVPIFILLRDDGTIAGRIETFASVSPDDATCVRGDLRRLDELLATVDKAGEEENFHPSTTRSRMSAQGGLATVTLSGADLADTFEITNAEDYATLVVTAKGTHQGGVEHLLSVYEKKDETLEQIVSKKGTPDGKMSVTVDVVPGATYYARLELTGLTDLALFGQDAPIRTEATISCALAYSHGTIAFEDDSQSAFVPDGEGSVTVVRKDGGYGPAAAKVVMRDAGTVEGCFTLIETNLVWASGETNAASVSFTMSRQEGLVEGSVVLGLEALPGNCAEISSGTHTVTLTDTTDPCFADFNMRVGSWSTFASEDFFDLRNVDTSKSVTFVKVAGSLPSGMYLKYDRTTGTARLYGTPKYPGTYMVSYAVKQRGVTGLPAVFTITVDDPKEKNAFVGEKRTSQTFALKAESGTNSVVAGTLTVAVTSKNKISAKYQGTESKTVSFSGTWSDIDESGSVVAVLEKSGCVLSLEMDGAGALQAELSLPDGLSYFGNELFGVAPWPSTDFSDWDGQYALTLVDRAGNMPRTVPSGTECLTFTVSAKGVVKWSGTLANGTSVSGSSQLESAYVDVEGDTAAAATLFKRKSADVFGAKIAIKANGDRWYDTTYLQMIHDAPTLTSYLLHRATGFSYLTYQDALGGWYIPYASPAELCETFGYDTENLTLRFDTSVAESSEKHGALVDIGDSTLVAGEKKIAFGEKAEGVTFAFTRKTGAFSGRAKLHFEDGASVSGTYKGVLLPGWENCGCVEGRKLVDRPFGSGTFYFKDVVGGRSAVRSCPVNITARKASETR